MRSVKQNLVASVRWSAATVHTLLVDGFHVYNSLIQAGWYEAIEHSVQKDTQSQCPVRRFITKGDGVSSQLKDTTA